jgi:hypothetical protein
VKHLNNSKVRFWDSATSHIIRFSELERIYPEEEADILGKVIDENRKII